MTDNLGVLPCSPTKFLFLPQKINSRWWWSFAIPLKIYFFVFPFLFWVLSGAPLVPTSPLVWIKMHFFLCLIFSDWFFFCAGNILVRLLLLLLWVYYIRYIKINGLLCSIWLVGILHELKWHTRGRAKRENEEEGVKKYYFSGNNGGGGRHNMFLPCYSSTTTTINNIHRFVPPFYFSHFHFFSSPGKYMKKRKFLEKKNHIPIFYF